jgi:hypothetical protein
MTICANLLSIKDIVVAPELTDTEALVEPTTFVGFCEKPRCMSATLVSSSSSISKNPGPVKLIYV